MPHHTEDVEQLLMDQKSELKNALQYVDTSMIADNGALIEKETANCPLSRRPAMFGWKAG